MNRPNRLHALLLLTALFALAACAEQPGLIGITPQPYPITPDPTLPPAEGYPPPAENSVAPTSTPVPLPPEPAPESAPVLFTDYNLGDATIVQSWFPEDSNFHNMPVRLEGILGLPEGSERLPVVLILHGNHATCPLNEFSVDAWPCTPDEERHNYRGFEYLVRELAARGYLALAININAEATFGFGEPVAGKRLQQLVDLHLLALGEAGAGGANNFGLPLDGRVDLSRMVWMGHSRGAELASFMIRERDLASEEGAAEAGYGPVSGQMHIAGAVSLFAPEPLPDIPLATLLSGCDADVIDLDGQYYFEAARNDPARDSLATAVLLEQANHNAFNTVLSADLMPSWREMGCSPEQLLDPQAQRDFLVAYAADFLALTLGDGAAAAEAAATIGLNAGEPVPPTMYGQDVQVLYSPPAADDRLLLRPFAATELATNLAGGSTTATNLEVVFCPPGFFVPEEGSELQACRRTTASQPGAPQQLSLAWESAGAELALALPEPARDVRGYESLRLRAALDPLAAQNEIGEPLTFMIRLRDAAGGEATAPLTLPWPAGVASTDESSGLELFSGHVFMREFRFPLHAFPQLDLGQLSEVGLVFDQNNSGAVFVADLGFIAAGTFPGSHSTLLQNSDGFLDPLSGVGRLSGPVDCTSVLIDSGGGSDAPAYALSSGRCAQEPNANAVLLNQPAGERELIFNYFGDTPQQQVRVPVRAVAYSTMKGRDLAVLELDATLGALDYLGIQPLRLAAAPLAAEALPLHVQLVGAARLPDPAASYLRHERCELDGRADLLEATQHAYDAYRTTCRDVYGSSAGSPVFAADGDEIIALISTVNVHGRHPCTLGMACEIAQGKLKAVPGASYATPVDGLGGCFTADGRFDLQRGSCPLDDGRQLTVSDLPAQPVQPTTVLDDGAPAPATWNAALSGDLPFYRYKTGPATTTDCRAEEGYSEVLALAERPSLADALPGEDGSYVLCVVAGESATVDETWQDMSEAIVARLDVDGTPPLTPPRLTAVPVEGFLLVRPVIDPPELANFLLKAGPPETTDCADNAGYFRYRRVPLRLPADQAPWTVCVVGLDSAGNAAMPVARQIFANKWQQAP